MTDRTAYLATHPMMGCGHRANATRGSQPACAICSGIHDGALTAVPEPDLAGRTARCSCGTTKPSDDGGLAFFEYQGPGSRRAVNQCKTCGIVHEAHQKINPHTGRAGITAHEFEPAGPQEFDIFYCGHAGWD